MTEMDPFVDNYPADLDDHNYYGRRGPLKGKSSSSRQDHSLGRNHHRREPYHSLQRNHSPPINRHHSLLCRDPNHSLLDEYAPPGPDIYIPRELRLYSHRQYHEPFPADDIHKYDGYDSSERFSDGKPDTFCKYDNSESSGSDEEGASTVAKEGFDIQGCGGKPCKPLRPIRRGAVYVVSVDGYFRKARSNRAAKGGYGVIIRRMGGQTVVAKTGCAPVARSGFFHTLEAVKKGLELAAEYPDITRLFVACNSDKVAFIVNHNFMSGVAGRCRMHPAGTPLHDYDVFCAQCFSCNVPGDEVYDDILDLMKGIVKLGKLYCTGPSLVANCGRDSNKHADYLAKMQVDETVLKPHEFPSELKTLVSKMEKIGIVDFHPS